MESPPFGSACALLKFAQNSALQTEYVYIYMYNVAVVSAGDDKSLIKGDEITFFVRPYPLNEPENVSHTHGARTHYPNSVFPRLLYVRTIYIILGNRIIMRCTCNVLRVCFFIFFFFFQTARGSLRPAPTTRKVTENAVRPRPYGVPM